MTANNDAVKSVNGGESMDFFTPNDATMDFFGDGFSFFGSSDEPAAPQQEPEKEQKPVEPEVNNADSEPAASSAPEKSSEDVAANNDQQISETDVENDNKTENDDEAAPQEKEETAPVKAEEPAADEKPKKKARKTRVIRKSASKSADDEDSSLDVDKNVAIKNTRNASAPQSDEVFTIPVNPHLDIRNIVSSLNLVPDTSFAEAQKDIQTKMNAIKVERNIDKANIMLMYDLVDELSDILRARYAIAKTIYDNLINKDVGIIANIRKLNTVGAGTVADKERNAIMCLVNYKTDDMDEPVNLIQLAWAASYEYNFIESAIDQLETKRRLLKGMEDAIV